MLNHHRPHADVQAFSGELLLKFSERRRRHEDDVFLCRLRMQESNRALPDRLRRRVFRRLQFTFWSPGIADTDHSRRRRRRQWSPSTSRR